MKINHLVLCILFLFSFPIISFSQWTPTGNALTSNNRVFINQNNQTSPTQRMGIITSTDRIGLYVENATTAQSGTLPLDPSSYCYPEATDPYGFSVSLYVAPSPVISGYSGFFGGRVGICEGGLWLTESGTSNSWRMNRVFNNDLSFYAAGSDSEFKFLGTPTSSSAYVNIILEDGANKAFEVLEGTTLNQTLGASKFFVLGNGKIDTKYGMTVHTGQTNQPIQLLETGTGNELFSIEDNGNIDTKYGLTVHNNQTPYPIKIVSTVNGLNRLAIKGDGHISTMGGFRITTMTTEWKPIDMVEDDGTAIFSVTRSGVVTTKRGFEVVDDDDIKQFKVTKEGYIEAREVKVTLNPIPDYVFETDYPLLPLNKLKEYIEKNKHLPNIPSAKEIEKNGIGLGDLQVRELEKIEELTLYILQLNERLEKLEQENVSLKKLISKH